MGTQIFWPDLISRWDELPRDVQRRTVRTLGRRLHDLWSTGIDLRALPLELTTFTRQPDQLEWHIRPTLFRYRSHPLSPEALRSCLADWHSRIGHVLSPLCLGLLVRSLLRSAGLERDQIQAITREMDAEHHARAKMRPVHYYRQALQIGQDQRGGIYRGHWAPDERMSAALIATAVNQIEGDTANAYVKSTRKTKLRRVQLFGRDVMLKQFDLPRTTDRLKARFRISRARRAWAAAKALEGLGIATPKPLGYLELKGRWLPLRSYVFTEFQPDSIDLREWLRNNHQTLTDNQKERLETGIETMLMSLYTHRIYHTDTKLSNLLAVRSPGNPDALWTQLLWIDLEGLRFHCSPTRHRVIRNLVQINGSIRDAWMSRADRLPFLRRMAQHFPWLLSQRILDRITRWTQRRWRRERDTRCGP